MRLNQRMFGGSLDRSPILQRSSRTNGSLVDGEEKGEGSYKEEIKRLQERIRKSEIEKAELDLKLTQVENKENFVGKDSVCVTKMLYLENRELKKQIKGLQEELGLFRIERGKYKLNEVKNSLSPEKCRSSVDGAYKKKYTELKSVLDRQKVNNLKKVAAMRIMEVVNWLADIRKRFFFCSEALEKCKIVNLDKILRIMGKKKNQNVKNEVFKAWKQIVIIKRKKIKIIFMQFTKRILIACLQIWKKKNSFQKFGNFCFKLKKKMLFFHKIGKLSKSFSRMKDYSSQKKIEEYSKAIKDLQTHISKTLSKKKLQKSLQHQLITVIFLKNLRRVASKDFKFFIQNLRKPTNNSWMVKILKNVLMKKQKLRLIQRFNQWKHCVYNLTITDLCKLHEEQRVEKDFLIEQFDMIRMEDSEVLSSKFKLSALKSLKSTNDAVQKQQKKKLFTRWANFTKVYRERKTNLRNGMIKIDKIGVKRKISAFFWIVFYKKPQKNTPMTKLFEKIVKNKLLKVKKVFKVFEFNTQKKKLIGKYLEKLLKQRNHKQTLNNFRKFYQNTKLHLLKTLKEESFLMTQNNKFLEQSLNTANSVIQDSGLILSAFEKRMQNKSLRLALGLSINNAKFFTSECFSIWKNCLLKNTKVKSFLDKLRILNGAQKLMKSKSFYCWKLTDRSTSAKKSSLHFWQLASYKVKSLMSESFNCWKVYKSYSELIEAIEHEKLNNLIYKVANVLLKCKKIKIKSSFTFWLKKIKAFQESTLILQKISKTLNKRASKQLKKAFSFIISTNFTKTKRILPTLFINILKKNLKLQLLTGFSNYSKNIYRAKTEFYKSDCQELIKLAEYSEKLLLEKDKSLQQAVAKTKSFKRTIKKSISWKISKLLIKKCFYSWQKYISKLKSALEKYCSVFKRILNRKFLQKMKALKYSITDLMAVESPNQCKIFQESLEFDISDPSILPFNYKKLTPIFDTKEKSYKSLKLSLILKYKSYLNSIWNKWRLQTKSLRTQLHPQAIRISSKLKSALILTKFLISSKKYPKALNFTFTKWLLSTKTLNFKSKKPEKSEELIKKLLQENLNMAYKLSTAQVTSKNFMKLTTELCNAEKENLLPPNSSLRY